MAKAKTVDGYIAGLGDWRADVVSRLRDLITEAAPNASESIKWAQPVFEDNGPFSYVKAFKNHVNFGFWRGVDLTDEVGVLEGSGEKMRHVKLNSIEDIQEDVFRELVREAVALNRSKGDPTKGL
ncbi:MAG: DUF1801 domain-containing protein [Anaerolineae bacterium]|jgi:hypothetical protein